MFHIFVISLQLQIFTSYNLYSVFHPFNVSRIVTAKQSAEKADFFETGRPQSVAERWPHLPGPPPRTVTGEDAHGDHGCQTLFPWCQRMIGFMDPDSALWQHGGTLCCTWEKKHWQDVKCYWTRSPRGSSYDLSHIVLPTKPLLCQRGIYSQASCYTLRILGLNFSFVWAWLRLCVRSVRLCWICRQQCPGLKSEIARTPLRQLMLLWIVSCH